MNLSVSLYSAHPLIASGEKSVGDIITFLHNNGVKYVELLDIYLTTAQQRTTALALLNQYGMKVSSYSISNEFVLVTDSEREAQIEYLKECCEIAKFFDTGIVRVFAGNMDQAKTKSYDECVGLIVDSFKKCVPYAEQNGIVFCLENHGLLAGKAEQVKYILDEVSSPALKATVDTGNFRLVGDDPYNAVETLLDYIGHVHFKDVTVLENGQFQGLDGNSYSGTIIGKGDVDLPSIVSMLKTHSYSGYVSIEYEAPEHDCLDAVAQSIKYTQALL